MTFIVWASNTYGQDKGYIAFNAGSSNPVGTFASKNLNEENSGFAKSGFLLDLSFGYKLGKTLGISAMIRNHVNQVHGQPMADYFAYIVGKRVTLEVKPYLTRSFLVGGYNSIPVSNKVSFENRLMIGYAITRSPELILKYSGGEIKQEKVNAGALAYLIGAGFKFNTGQKTSLLLNFDYLGQKPEFSSVKISGNTNLVGLNTYSQPASTINISFGIAHRL